MTTLHDQLEKLGELDRRVLEHYFEHKLKGAAYKSVYPKRSSKHATDFFKRRAILDIIAEYNRGVSEVTRECMQKQGIDKAYIQSKLQLLVEFNIRKFLTFHKGVPYYNFQDATEDDWYCLGEMSASDVLSAATIESDGKILVHVSAVKIKPNCKLKALELLGKTEAVYTDRQENNDVHTIVMADSYEFEEDEDDET